MKAHFRKVFLLTICLSTSFVQAQIFENYAQEIAGESFKIEMIAIEGGHFIMGAESDDESRNSDEKPAHKVKIDSLWMGKYEITWEQFDAFVFSSFNAQEFVKDSVLNKLGIDAVTGASTPYDDTSGGMGKESFPAVNMTQYTAILYCKWLTAKTGVFYRLPTEAEWEYVCKKGRTDAVDTLNVYAVYNESINNKSMSIGSKRPNSLGIYDMLGNVSEWVLDQYSEDFYDNSPVDNPWNIPEKLYPRVLRGGSWKDTADKSCCTYRQPSSAKWKMKDPQIPKSKFWHTNAPFIGFRLVRPYVQPSKEEIEQYWLEVIEDYGF